MVIVNIKKEDSKKAFKKEAVFKVPKIKGYPTIRIEKGCDFQRNTNFSYSSQPLCTSAAEGFAFRFVTIIWMNTVITANANCFCVTACILVINTIVYAA